MSEYAEICQQSAKKTTIINELFRDRSRLRYELKAAQKDKDRLEWLMARNRNIYTDRDAIDDDMADPDMNDNPHETIRDLDALGVRSNKKGTE